VRYPSPVPGKCSPPCRTLPPEVAATPAPLRRRWPARKGGSSFVAGESCSAAVRWSRPPERFGHYLGTPMRPTRTTPAFKIPKLLPNPAGKASQRPSPVSRRLRAQEIGVERARSGAFRGVAQPGHHRLHGGGLLSLRAVPHLMPSRRIAGGSARSPIRSCIFFPGTAALLVLSAFLGLRGLDSPPPLLPLSYGAPVVWSASADRSALIV